MATNTATKTTVKPAAKSKGRDNLTLWQQVEKTDPHYTKPFNHGGFKGTAVNATYLAKRATETFGPMGIGWGIEVLEEDLMAGAPLDQHGTRELIHKVRVKLWYKLDGERGELVQFGQTTFVGRNRYGLFTDEEAPKKSLTDAMSKCLSLLGFSADVFLGRFDDSKYLREVTAEFAQKRNGERAQPSQPVISSDQADELANLLGATGTDVAKFCEFFNIDSLAELPAKVYDRAVALLQKKTAVAAAAA